MNLLLGRNPTEPCDIAIAILAPSPIISIALANSSVSLPAIRQVCREDVFLRIEPTRNAICVTYPNHFDVGVWIYDTAYVGLDWNVAGDVVIVGHGAVAGSSLG